MIGAAAGVAAASTLCRPDEAVVFLPDRRAHCFALRLEAASATEGYLQYRYGAGDRIDLAYPDLSTRAADAFTSGRMMFSGGGGAWLRFDKGPYTYTIFTAIGRWGHSGSPASVAGVAVEKDGKGFANFPCRSAEQSEIGPDLFDKDLVRWQFRLKEAP